MSRRRYLTQAELEEEAENISNFDSDFDGISDVASEDDDIVLNSAEIDTDSSYPSEDDEEPEFTPSSNDEEYDNQGIYCFLFVATLYL